MKKHLQNQISRRLGLIFLLLSTFVLVPPEGLMAQEGSQTQNGAKAGGVIPAPVLKPTQVQKLGKLLRSWYQYDIKIKDLSNLEFETGRAKGAKARKKKLQKTIARLKKNARKRKREFFAEFEKQGKDVGSLLKHIGDLTAITDGCFQYPKQSNGGKTKELKVFPKARKPKLPLRYSLRYPKAYKPDRNWPLIYCLPNKVGRDWVASKKYLDAAYPATNSATLDNYLIAVPRIPKEMDLSVIVDVRKEDDAAEKVRIGRVLGIMGAVFKEFPVNTDRVFLEASGSSVPFAVRLASLFPDRFCGLILKDPPDNAMENLVADNFGNIAMLVLYTEKSKAMASSFAAALPTCKSQAAKDELPMGSDAGEIAAWAGNVVRNVYAKHIVLAQASNLYKKAYWVEIRESVSLGQIPLDERPRIEVTADRAKNKVTIKARNVSEVRILLNDLLVDLDKEINFDLNGKIVKVKRSRNKNLLWDTDRGFVVSRGDPRFLFLTVLSFPISEPANGDDGGESTDASAGSASKDAKDAKDAKGGKD